MLRKIIATHVISVFFKGLWSDSRSGNFTNYVPMYLTNTKDFLASL